MKVSIRFTDNGCMAFAETHGLGTIVVASGRDEYQTQTKAARFMDANFPGEEIEWEGGYHGGDTEVSMHSSYYNERVV